jgi:hypothetical protein
VFSVIANYFQERVDVFLTEMLYVVKGDLFGMGVWKVAVLWDNDLI